MTGDEGVDEGRTASRVEAALLALCVAALVASGWVDELMGDPAVSSRSWLADIAICAVYAALIAFHGKLDGLWESLLMGAVGDVAGEGSCGAFPAHGDCPEVRDDRSSCARSAVPPSRRLPFLPGGAAGERPVDATFSAGSQSVAPAGRGARRRSRAAVWACRLSFLLGAVGVLGGVCRGVSCVVGGAVLPVAQVCQAIYEACLAVLLMATLCACAWRASRWAPFVLPGGYALAASLQFILRALPSEAAVAVAPALPLAAGLMLAACAVRCRGAEGAGRGVPDDPGCAGAAAAAPSSADILPAKPKAPAAPEATASSAARTGNACAAACDTSASRVSQAGSSARGSRQSPTDQQGPTRQPGPDGLPDSAGQRWTFPVRPVALMCVYAFAFKFSIFFSEGPNPYGMLGILLVSLVAFVAAVLRASYSATFLYKLALPLMVAGLVCLAFLGEGRTVAVSLVSSGQVAFLLFLYITLSTLCMRYAVSPVWVFAAVQLASELSGLLGVNAGREFTAVCPVGSDGANLAMCCLVVGVVVVSTVVFNDEVVSRSFGIVPARAAGGMGEAAGGGAVAAGRQGPEAAMSYSERVVWRCAQMSRRYGLTLREQEVLELMVQGLSVPDVAERAGISYGTAKTHVNHIYRKLDVHSRDEALALMHRELG